MNRIGIIGFGVMGEAFAAGLKAKLPAAALSAFDVRRDHLVKAAGARGVAVAGSPAEILSSTDLAILCVKPQDLAALAAEVKGTGKGRRVISILAGRKIAAIADALGTNQVARFMPNVAATQGASLVGVAFDPEASAEMRADSLAVAAALGSALEIPEKLMAAMTGVSGSGIAFAFAFAHAMALGGVASGFDYPTAARIAASTMESAAAMIKAGGHPVELESRVISPAGTTIQGVRALEQGGMAGAVMAAVEAAARKAADMET